MEVKISDAVPDWLVNKLSELKIYKTSFSKYGRAYQNFIREQLEDKKKIYISGISLPKSTGIILTSNKSAL